MQVKSCDLLRLHTPFKKSFNHSQSARSYSDKILVVLTTTEGRKGFGEVLARSYVSGETNDEVFNATGPEMANELVGQEFNTLNGLTGFLNETLLGERWGPAVFGGFELALLNVFAQTQAVSLESLLGAGRESPTGHCMTIGFECTDSQIRRYAMQAKLSRATTVKVKVGLPNDVERLMKLNEFFKSKMPIRLDANGCFSLEQAKKLLSQVRELPIQSFEQPLAADAAQLEEQLIELYQQERVPLMADESLCTQRDAERWIASQAYQVFNIRVGKCGGLLGSVKIRDMALRAGIGIVAGTMVGESGVLNHASELLLQHTEQLGYVEGLGQNRSFLAQDPVSISYSSELNPLAVNYEISQSVRDQQLISEQSIE